MRAALPLVLVASPAAAQELEPIVDARLRYEQIEQDGIARNAEAITARVRAGAQLKQGDWSVLGEAEATLALSERYNNSINGRTRYPLVPDPETVEINRLQLQYRGIKGAVLTAGRQRILLDDQRFVGNVGWRQNEQTYDAVRAEAKAGPLALDLAYAWNVQTVFGADSPIASIRGDNLFASAGVKLGPVAAKGFAVLVDQDHATRRPFSSQTYGLRMTGALPVGAAKLALAASYARQSDWASNPNRYAADYWFAEAQLQAKALGVSAGYEVLGADDGRALTSFQTPLATLHKFQGWADKFLTTPADGVRDLYLGASTALGRNLPVTLQATWHRFASDRLDRRYGDEWNVQLGFKPRRQLAAALKYAEYRAASFATDTRKLWLQLDYSL